MQDIFIFEACHVPAVVGRGVEGGAVVASGGDIVGGVGAAHVACSTFNHRHNASPPSQHRQAPRIIEWPSTPTKLVDML